MACQQSKCDVDFLDNDDDNIFKETPRKLYKVVEYHENVKDIPNTQVCRFCQTLFSSKKHCKRHEATCSLNKGKPPKFPCPQCKREYNRKDNLSNHVKTCLTKTVFSCKFCLFKFSTKKNCVVHERKCDVNPEKRQPIYECAHCNSVFHKKYNLKQHLRRCFTEKPLSLRSKTPCLVRDCDASFYHKIDLIHHFSLNHKNVVAIKPKVMKTFSSMEEFSKWKEQEEENTFSYFTARRGQTKKQIQHFYCQHDGSAKLHAKRKTSKRTYLGSVKVGHYCIAKMKMAITDDKTINVTYYPTHNHSCKQEDQARHPIPAAMSQFIDLKLAENIPPDVVFELAKEHFTPKNNSEVHNGRADNLTRNLVFKRAWRKRMALRLDKDDAKSVFLLAAQHIEKDNSILIYKPLGMNVVHGPQGINNLPDAKNLFMFGFQTESQLALMKRHCSKILIVDETHNTNQYKFQLLTAMVVDENRRGWPVAHLISSKSDGDTFKYFFQALRSRLQNKNEVSLLNCVMTDDDPALINGMTAGFGHRLTHLLCKWHLLKKFKENLRSKASKKLFDEMWSEIKVIINAKEESLFLKLKNGFINKYEGNPDAAEYMFYLKERYWGRAEKWCMCYRNFPHANVDTTGHLESFHNRLKSNFLKRKCNKRLDDLITLLYDIAWYDDRTRRKEAKKGFAGQPQKIFERHRKGLLLGDEVIVEETPESGLWEMKAGSGNDTYFISRNMHNCELDLCFIKCSKAECNSLCAHLFCCSCPDTHPLCKHIHKLQSVLFRNIPRISIQEDFYNFETAQNLESREELNNHNEINDLGESSTTHEMRKKTMCGKLRDQFAVFQEFMSQDLEKNVSEHLLLRALTTLSSLVPSLIAEGSEQCSAVAVPLMEPSINFAPNEKLRTQMEQLASFKKPPKRRRKEDISSLAAKKKQAMESLLENADTDTADTDGSNGSDV